MGSILPDVAALVPGVGGDDDGVVVIRVLIESALDGILSFQRLHGQVQRRHGGDAAVSWNQSNRRGGEGAEGRQRLHGGVQRDAGHRGRGVVGGGDLLLEGWRGNRWRMSIRLHILQTLALVLSDLEDLAVDVGRGSSAVADAAAESETSWTSEAGVVDIDDHVELPLELLQAEDLAAGGALDPSHSLAADGFSAEMACGQGSAVLLEARELAASELVELLVGENRVQEFWNVFGV